MVINWDAVQSWREGLGEEYPQYPLGFYREKPIEVDATLTEGWLSQFYVGLRQEKVACIVPKEMVRLE